MTISTNTRITFLVIGIGVLVLALFTIFFIVSADDASAQYSCTCNCFSSGGATQNIGNFSQDMTNIGCWCSSVGRWGLAQCSPSTRTYDSEPTSPQTWYFCATESNYQCKETGGVYATERECAQAVEDFRSVQGGNSETYDTRCFPSSSTCNLNCSKRWYFCGTNVNDGTQCLKTDYSYRTKEACELAVEEFRGSQTYDPTCYSTGASCATDSPCVTSHVLNVRSRVGGAPLDGVSITQISGSPSGMGGSTPYTRNKTSTIDVVLRAPNTARGYYFEGWSGCDSTPNGNCRVVVGADQEQSVTAVYNNCEPNSRLGCYQGDSYWYDSCGRRGQKNQECGTDSTGEWANFCKQGDVWERRTVYDRGCSSTTGACFNNTSTQERFVQSCNQCGCDSAQCMPPKVEAGLVADPSTGTEPLDVELRAAAGGCARGPINYHIWWNCSNDTNDISTAESTCGSLPTPASGSCERSGLGMRCIGVTNEEQTAIWPYTEGTYNAKVIIERETAVPATSEAIIVVDPLFIPERLPNPFARDDAGFAVYDAFTAMMVVATPVWVLMLFISGFQFLTAGGVPERIVMSKKIALYSTVGYGTVVVLWMTTAAISGVLF